MFKFIVSIIAIGILGAVAPNVASAEVECPEDRTLIQSVGGPLCVGDYYLDLVAGGANMDDPATCEFGYYQGHCAPDPNRVVESAGPTPGAECPDDRVAIDSVRGPICVAEVYLDSDIYDDPATCEHGFLQGHCLTAAPYSPYAPSGDDAEVDEHVEVVSVSVSEPVADPEPDDDGDDLIAYVVGLFEFWST